MGQFLVLKDRAYSLKSSTKIEKKWLVQTRQDHAVTQELTGATKAMLTVLKNLPDFASGQTLVSGDRCFPLRAQCSLAANALLGIYIP